MFGVQARLGSTASAWSSRRRLSALLGTGVPGEEKEKAMNHQVNKWILENQRRGEEAEQRMNDVLWACLVAFGAACPHCGRRHGFIPAWTRPDAAQCGNCHLVVVLAR